MEWIAFSSKNEEKFDEKRRQYFLRMRRKFTISRICTINHRQRNEEAKKNREKIIFERKMLVRFHLATVTYRHRVWSARHDYSEKFLRMMEENYKKLLKLNFQGFISGSDADELKIPKYFHESSIKLQLYPTKYYTQRLDNVSNIYGGISGIYFMIEFPKDKRLRKLPNNLVNKLNTTGLKLHSRESYDKKMENAERMRNTAIQEEKERMKIHLKHVQDVVNRFSRNHNWTCKLSGCVREFRTEDIGVIVKSKSTDFLERAIKSYKLERDVDDTEGRLRVVSNIKYKLDQDSFGINTLPTHDQPYDSLEVKLKKASLRRDLHIKYKVIKAHSMTIASRYKKYKEAPLSPCCFLDISNTVPSDIPQSSKLVSPGMSTGLKSETENTAGSRRPLHLRIEIKSPGQLDVSAKSPLSPGKKSIMMGRRSGYITSPMSRTRSRGFSDMQEL